MSLLLRSEIPGVTCRRGKVRDVYDRGNELVIVATDRISAYDWVLPSGIPDKGKVLTQLTEYWLGLLGVANHLISTDVRKMDPTFAAQANVLQGRTMLVRKANVVSFECVVRGYLAGSGWKEYCQTGTVCGLTLLPGLKECGRLPDPIFTPATKAKSGHDENVSFETMARSTGMDLANELRSRSVDLYQRAATRAEYCGILLADTKFEWGLLPDGKLILIDEALTPDSSRYWPMGSYKPGTNPPSYDKQFVRDWLETSGWDKNSPPPPLPDQVVRKTREKYVEAYQYLTGRTFVA